MERYIRTSPDTFSGKMKIINKLLKQDIHELNKQDIIFTFGKADDTLAEELRYLGCEVNKVADLFNVKLPDEPFASGEINKQINIERMY